MMDSSAMKKDTGIERGRTIGRGSDRYKQFQQESSYDELGEYLDDEICSSRSDSSYSSVNSDELEKILADDATDDSSKSNRYLPVPKIKTYEDQSDEENQPNFANGVSEKPSRFTPRSQKKGPCEKDQKANPMKEKMVNKDTTISQAPRSARAIEKCSSDRSSSSSRSTCTTPSKNLVEGEKRKDRKVTIPIPPRLETMAKYGERIYSCVTEEKEEVKEEVHNKWKDRKVTRPIPPRLETMAKNGERIYSCVTEEKEQVEEVDNKWIDRKVTRPITPRLETMAKNGERTYSCVTEEKEQVEEVDKWIDRKVTVPITPRLETMAKNGERTYSCVTEEREEVEEVDKWIDRRVTVPKPPKLTLLALHGEKSYSCSSKEDISIPSIDDSISHSNSSERRPTIPKSPKLMTRQKYGDRCYSSVADSSPLRETRADYPAWTEYKDKLIEQGALRENPVPDKPLRLTIPAPFRLSQPSPKVVNDKEEIAPKHEFRALPLPDFSFEPPQLVSLVTVPQPFHLSAEERETSRSRTSSSPIPEATARQDVQFKARPMPNFIVRSQSPVPKARSPTKQKPFRFEMSKSIENKKYEVGVTSTPSSRSQTSSRGRNPLPRSAKSVNNDTFTFPTTPTQEVIKQKASSTPTRKNPKNFTLEDGRFRSPMSNNSAPKSRRSSPVEKRDSESVHEAASITPRRRSITPGERQSNNLRGGNSVGPYQFKAKKMPDFSNPFIPKPSPRAPRGKPLKVLPHTHQFKARKMPDFSKPFSPAKKGEEQSKKGSKERPLKLKSSNVTATETKTLEMKRDDQQGQTHSLVEEPVQNENRRDVVQVNHTVKDEPITEFKNMKEFSSLLAMEEQCHLSKFEEDQDPLLLVMERLNQSLDKFRAYEQLKMEGGALAINADDNEDCTENAPINQDINSPSDKEESIGKSKSSLKDEIETTKLDLSDLQVDCSADDDNAFAGPPSSGRYTEKNRFELQVGDVLSDIEDEFENKSSCSMLSINDIVSSTLPSMSSRQDNNRNDFEVSSMTNLFRGGWHMAPEQKTDSNIDRNELFGEASSTHLQALHQSNVEGMPTSTNKDSNTEQVQIMLTTPPAPTTTPKHENKLQTINKWVDGQNQEQNQQQKQQEQAYSLFNPSLSLGSNDTDNDTTTDTMTGSSSSEMHSLIVLHEKTGKYDLMSHSDNTDNDTTTNTMSGSLSSEMNSLTVIPETSREYELMTHGTLSTDMIPQPLNLDTSTEIAERGIKQMDNKYKTSSKKIYNDEDKFDLSIDTKIENKKRKKKKLSNFFDGQKFIYRFCCASPSTQRKPSPLQRFIKRGGSKN